MKSVVFDYVRPQSVDEAIAVLSQNANAKPIAGGQTLGPMLNLRLARPNLLVDISRIPELQRVEDQGDSVLIGACVTHAAIEDCRFRDPTGGLLPAVAQSIAYRAVRNRGTIGGSIAHADPAADWLTALVAMGAAVMVAGPGGRRQSSIESFVTGALATALSADELVIGLRVAKLSRVARWGWHKICRKHGEFAVAIGAVVTDPERGMERAVAGATGGKPIVIGEWSSRGSAEDWRARLSSAGYQGDAYDMQVHAVALERAAREAAAA